VNYCHRIAKNILEPRIMQKRIDLVYGLIAALYRLGISGIKEDETQSVAGKSAKLTVNYRSYIQDMVTLSKHWKAYPRCRVDCGR